VTEEHPDLDRLACLAGRSREVSELPGGLTNLNLRVSLPDREVVVRAVRSDEGLLAIDRAAEHANTVAAAEAGVGANVVEHRPELGITVLEFLPGRTLTNDDFADEGVRERAADAVRRLHAGPRFVNDFDMFARQRWYRKVVAEQGFWLPASYDDHAAAWDDVRRVLTATAGPTVPCNNDLLAGNILDDGRRLWLIDYEYAGNNEACFELGNIWSEARLDPAHLDVLMAAYDGRLRRSRVARARLWGLMSKYGWMLWASIQASVSTVDFDFWSWGMEKYDRAVAEFESPVFARLLTDVTEED
jgi:thiamine kinase-like enzyme